MAVAGKWSSLQGVVLNKAVTNALETAFGFPCMTPVQAAAIPPLLSSQDVSVDAETGSGKTLSFLVPIAQSILFGRECHVRKKPSRALMALIILPTRELAAQVKRVAQRLFSALPGDISPCAVIGGGAGPVKGSALDDVRDMRVVISTPGLLNAELLAGSLSVSALEFLILDEADRLLDMGFDVTLSSILARLPKQRRTGLYSATQTAGVEDLARAGLRNPVRIAVKISVKGKGKPGNSKEKTELTRTPTSLTSYHHVIPQDDKLISLCAILSQRPNDKFIVYFLTCASVHYHSLLPLVEISSAVAKRVSSEPEPSTREFFPLHGKMMQKKRTRNLRKFAASSNGVLLCTDVAARGIDLPDVDTVVQFDAPQDPDVYVHRVGRTARLGREGYAVILLSPSEDTYVEFLKIRKCPVVSLFEHGSEFLGERTEKLPCLSSSSKAGDDEVQDRADTERKQVESLILECTVTNRAILDASERAFLSYIRGYKEHKCGFILKLDNLDIGAVARSFRLLRMPKFHEFKRLKSKLIFKKEEGIRIRDIPYKDKAQEAKRQKDIQEATVLREKGKQEGKGKRKREAERQKAKRKRGKSNSASKQKEDDEEEDDFGYEAWQLKKRKRGKMSRKEFDSVTRADDNSL